MHIYNINKKTSIIAIYYRAQLSVQLANHYLHKKPTPEIPYLHINPMPLISIPTPEVQYQLSETKSLIDFKTEEAALNTINVLSVGWMDGFLVSNEFCDSRRIKGIEMMTPQKLSNKLELSLANKLSRS